MQRAITVIDHLAAELGCLACASKIGRESINMKNLTSRRRLINYGLLGSAVGIVAVAWFINLYCINCGIDWDQIPIWPILLIPSYIGGSLSGRFSQNWALAILGGVVGAFVGSLILTNLVLRV